MYVVMLVGLALEVLGLGLTGWGLLRAWRVCARGRPFFPSWLRTAYWKVAGLWGGRPKPRIVPIGVADELTVAGSASRRMSRIPDAPLDERVERLERDVDSLQDAVGRLDQADQATRRDLRAADRELRSEIQSTKTSLERRITEDAIYQLRPAIYGLALAAFGLVLQFVAAV